MQQHHKRVTIHLGLNQNIASILDLHDVDVGRRNPSSAGNGGPVLVPLGLVEISLGVLHVYDEADKVVGVGPRCFKSRGATTIACGGGISRVGRSTEPRVTLDHSVYDLKAGGRAIIRAVVAASVVTPRSVARA